MDKDKPVASWFPNTGEKQSSSQFATILLSDGGATRSTESKHRGESHQPLTQMNTNKQTANFGTHFIMTGIAYT